MDLLLFPAIGNQIFYYLPVHQRFPAEEIHFQVSSLPGICNQEIQCLLSNFKGHQRPASMVLALLGKAVFTRQVTVMSDMQAQRLHHRLSLFYFVNIVLIDIPGKQASLSGQFRHSLQNIPEILLGTGIAQLLFQVIPGFWLPQSFDCLKFILPLKRPDHIIGCLIHYMDSPAVHIKDDIISIILIQMYHKSTSLSLF